MMVPSSIVILSAIRRAKRTRRRAKTLRRRRQRDAEHLLLLLLLLCLSLSLVSLSLSLRRRRRCGGVFFLSFDFWKRLVHPNPQTKKKQKRGRFLWPQKFLVPYSFSQKGIVERDLSLFFKSFLCSLQDLYVRVRSRQKKKKRERVLVCNVWILVSKKKSKNREERERERTLSCVTTTSRKRDSSILSTP